MSKYYTISVLRFLLLAGLALCSQPLGAQAKTWTNAAGTGLWSTGGNWSPAGAPGPGNDVVFDNTSSANCSININPTVNSLEVESNYGGIITLNSNTLSVSGDFKVEGAAQLSNGAGSKVVLGGGGRIDCVAPLHTVEVNTAQPNDVLDFREPLQANELIITQVGKLDGDDLLISQQLVNNDPDLDGDAIISITGNCTFTGNGLQFLNIEAGASLQLLSGLTLERDFELTGSGNITGGGTLTLGSEGRLDYAGTVAADATFNTAGAADRIRLSDDFSVAGKLTFTQVGELTGPNDIRAGGDITVNDENIGDRVSVIATGSGELTGSGSLTLLTVEAGASLQLPADFTLKNDFSLEGGGTINGPGKLILGSSGWVEFSGSVFNVEVNVPGARQSSISFRRVFNIANGLFITRIGSLRGADVRVGGDITVTDADISGSARLVLAGSGASAFQGAGGGNYVPTTLAVDKDNSTDKVVLNSSDLFLEAVIISGILDLNGQTLDADLTIGSNGTLAGAGTVDGALTGEGGSLISPGNSTGIITINGDVGLAGSLYMEITGPGQNNGGTPGADFDRLNVSGSATIGAINIIFIGAIGPGFPMTGDSYTLVSSTGGTTAGGFSISPSNINASYNNGILLISNPALPIELLSFTASARNQSVVLEWTTATERNNDYMAIERSADGVRFREIGRLSGAGTTEEPQAYRFVDEKPLPGLSYYRLRQVDFDGAAEYHKAISILFESKEEGLALQVYPNPVQATLQASWAPVPGQPATLRLLSTDGRLLTEYSVPAGGVLELPLGGLPAGPYFLQAIQGGKVDVARFVKY